MKYEYKAISTLTGDSARNIRIPKTIIVDSKLLSIRISLFVYLSIYKGLNNKLCFSIPLFLEWAGYKCDAHGGGINDKVIMTLYSLAERNYVTVMGTRPLTRNGCAEVIFNTQLVHEDCQRESFAIIYLDEIDKIMGFRNDNVQDRYLNRNVVLLVFAFLRQAIFRTPNALKPEEQSKEGIKQRKERCVEAYNNSYKDIAAILGLSNRMVSAAAQILVRLGLIALAEPYHIRNQNGDFRTMDIIFSNVEKREKNELLAIGKEYSLGEIKRKEVKIQKAIPEYHIREVRLCSETLKLE